jgi:acetyltransferase-like isoleucine patch superfamily enzyme
MSFNKEETKRKDVKIGEGSSIKAKKVIIGDNVIIGENVKIHCLDTFEVGDFTIIKSNVTITCNNFKAGKWLYMCSDVEVGRGGCFNEDSNVTIGDHVGIFEKVVINPNSEITIGDNCGIGSEVMIWTHGAWLDPLQGYPREFGPVSIGKNVWLPARTILLPNVRVGDNSVIGTNSLVNKDIPPGSLAAGIPIKVLKENQYPKSLDTLKKNMILQSIINDWLSLISFKRIQIESIVNNDGVITLNYDRKITSFDISSKAIDGDINEVSEDFRDFLRRNGIKIYTDRHFKSI